ncbi:MAG TPA: PHP domain-containing protein, partial [Chitinophagaceae bacterium]|nr:PHP domain-containing protein [Chitinophagaceae bacterium]
DQIEGVFHNHTNRSDGLATLEEMVLGAKKRGYKYIGISDHSQSSFYANGLKSDQLKEQEKEVRALQDKHPEIRIFWGIECDILQDGALDYPDSILKKFDFIVASVHQRFKLDQKVMTERIVRAIEHPSVNMLGHLTGRLLLDRPGYEIDIEKIIRVAAENDRRINRIYLTKQAQKLQEETMAMADDTLNEALVKVPADRVDVCKEVLQIVYDNLK